jgi:beta-lactam-binding protein with PASTA domain
VAVVPDLIGMDVAAAQAKLRELGLIGTWEGPGTRVLRQFPVGNAKVPKETNVILYTDSEEEQRDGEVRVPSILGMGLTSARSTLSEVGLTLSAQGSGFCVSKFLKQENTYPRGRRLDLYSEWMLEIEGTNYAFEQYAQIT